jgi:O-methyltransferase
MLGNVIRWLYQRPTQFYFRWGGRFIAKAPTAFCREVALDQGMEFLRQCEVGGDYVEFGVFQGRNFSGACLLGREYKLAMSFWAFDSFAGLPATEGEFKKGEFECGQDDFLRNVKNAVGHLTGVHIVPGWFSESLVPGNPALAGLGKVALAWIDCDLYESTKPVLEFLTPRLQHGSLLFFDDWFCFKGSPDCGEQRACQEWLSRNPKIRLMPYSQFGWNGKSFIVHFVESSNAPV